MSIAIIVHGGAGIITPERAEITQAGCKEAAALGWQVLQNNGSALAAVEAAVRALEDNPNYNAGTGSMLTADGRIEMDAGIMEGHTLNVGAVASVELIKNPILLAHRVLESPHVLLVGQGAQLFALEQGMALCRREDLVTQRQYERWLKARKEANDEPSFHRHVVGTVTERKEPGDAGKQMDEKKHGTVGAVALDQFGRLAAATSTGGILNKHPGRVGDSPLVGCGFYADENAAISCTGQGEDFMRLLIARHAADLVRQGASAREAAQQTIAFLAAKAQGTGGLILLDRRGEVGVAWNSEHMVHAYITSSQEMQVAI
ncbi:MAG TPA: isoaspartyl peptidase/L-asparaginase family protein [Ktedonobacteraceae bacterium]|nr:isoaspartyl peptidase/L-asparaginase family protein [Ktedonobacteraceae bacterium]